MSGLGRGGAGKPARAKHLPTCTRPLTGWADQLPPFFPLPLPFPRRSTDSPDPDGKHPRDAPNHRPGDPGRPLCASRGTFNRMASQGEQLNGDTAKREASRVEEGRGHAGAERGERPSACPRLRRGSVGGKRRWEWAGRARRAGARRCRAHGRCRALGSVWAEQEPWDGFEEGKDLAGPAHSRPFWLRVEGSGVSAEAGRPLGGYWGPQRWRTDKVKAVAL